MKWYHLVYIVNPAQLQPQGLFSGLQQGSSWLVAKHSIQQGQSEEDVSLHCHWTKCCSLAISITFFSCSTAVSYPQMNQSKGPSPPPPPCQHPSLLGRQGELSSVSAITEAAATPSFRKRPQVRSCSCCKQSQHSLIQCSLYLHQLIWPHFSYFPVLVSFKMYFYSLVKHHCIFLYKLVKI